MKLLSRITLAGMLLAASARAQNEQWLQYHTDSQIRSPKLINVTTNPPSGVALPKLNAAPYFARWITPMDPAGGRWLCLDRSRKSGPYDRLYIDSNGNGGWTTKHPSRRQSNPPCPHSQRRAWCSRGRTGRSLISF